MSQETGIKNRLLEARKSRGLTQAQVADRVGLSQAQISSMEKGRRGTPMPKWREIAKVLDVDIGWLLADEEPMMSDEAAWLKASADDANLPLGLRELIEDEALIKGLKFSGLEWTALCTLKAPTSLTKDGYVGVLYALRNGCAQDAD